MGLRLMYHYGTKRGCFPPRAGNLYNDRAFTLNSHLGATSERPVVDQTALRGKTWNSMLYAWVVSRLSYHYPEGLLHAPVSLTLKEL